MKAIIVSIIAAAAIIGGALIFANGGTSSSGAVRANNVSIVDGKQIIEIQAKGGYQPRKSTAKAGIPTIIRFNTKGTFDCSSSVRIPSLNISKALPQSGSTDIDIGVGKVGVLKGSCGMGMYPFEVEFQS
ncbi:MAG: cupredoxin domain-containing protein [Patescibacteria group bacterium]